jgi:hypothetical protein
MQLKRKMNINHMPCIEGNRNKILQSELWRVVCLTELFVQRDAEAVWNNYRQTLKLLETHQKTYKQTENSTQQARERDGAGCVICRPFHSPSISCSCNYCGILSSTPSPYFHPYADVVWWQIWRFKKCLPTLVTALQSMLQHFWTSSVGRSSTATQE